jgi:hypothetical protein
VLGDRAGIDAAGDREPHAVLLERLQRELVGASTDRLNEAQSLRARQEVVAPEPRDHQHVGLADPLLERGAVAHLEALDAGRERQEALAQPIGNMRKTDGQLVLGREHGDTSQFVGYADGARQRAECWLAASTRIVRVGTHLGDVVKESDYPLPGRCWGNNRRGAAIWIWSKVTVQRS